MVAAAVAREDDALSTVLRVGLISDTHDLVRPEAVDFLRGCDHIIHAGDIVGDCVLVELATLAPLTAVRGNHDRGAWADRLQRAELIELGDVFIYVLHDLKDLDLDPVAAGIHVVVSGHTHAPQIETRDGVLFINPGSAGPRRFTLPISVAELVIRGRQIDARLMTLPVAIPV
ncbi:MAG: metallophosphoesterase family protein [Thermomonas sp.]